MNYNRFKFIITGGLSISLWRLKSYIFAWRRELLRFLNSFKFSLPMLCSSKLIIFLFLLKCLHLVSVHLVLFVLEISFVLELFFLHASLLFHLTIQEIFQNFLLSSFLLQQNVSLTHFRLRSEACLDCFFAFYSLQPASL